MELADLRELAVDLSLVAGRVARQATRPELRRPRFDELKILRVRVDLDGAQPPIWRRLDLRCDLTLDAVHRVLQVAFDWTDSHLHRFSLGGPAFDPSAQLFLCPYDAEEGELDDEGGLPDSEVRLDETLQEPGDVLAYVYDSSAPRRPRSPGRHFGGKALTTVLGVFRSSNGLEVLRRVKATDWIAG